MKNNFEPTIKDKEIKKIIKNYTDIMVITQKHQTTDAEYKASSFSDKMVLMNAKTEIEKFLGRALFLLKISPEDNKKWVNYANELLSSESKMTEKELTTRKICVYNGELTAYGRERAKLCEGGHTGCSGPVKQCTINIDEFKHISSEAAKYIAPRCKNCWDNSNGEFDEQ